MSQSEKILFIDDDQPVRTTFQKGLGARGFDIDLADGAEQGRAMLEEQDYAVIAVDYLMPGTDGLTLIDEMRDKQPDATYMLVSGECDLALTLKAVNEYDVNFIVTKPWEIDPLESMMKRSLESHWEKVSQRRIQAGMVGASRSIEEQKKRLSMAMDEAEQHLAEGLLGTIGLRGHETKSHCRRVAAYALLLAEELGLNGHILSSIRQGGLLHDIGTIGIPDSILLKKGPLDEEEWHTMHSHPQIGARLMEGFDVLQGAQQIVMQHHERWDGSGYPAGLSERQICIGARIFAVADTLDALMSERPYRSAMTPEETRTEIESLAGKFFDPDVVTAYMRIPLQRIADVVSQHPDETPTA